jgi:hypothetical protein
MRECTELRCDVNHVWKNGSCDIRCTFGVEAEQSGGERNVGSETDVQSTRYLSNKKNSSGYYRCC